MCLNVNNLKYEKCLIIVAPLCNSKLFNLMQPWG